MQCPGIAIVPKNMHQKVQPPPLDPDKIYWDRVEELYAHVSNMDYDPNPAVKAYYTLIEQNGGDLRPLYYIQFGRYFSLVVIG